MYNKKITIKLPDYIENIFQNGYIDGENDYLKSIFDDRNMNLSAFLELNIQIYKDLLVNKKYDDPNFLKVKKNLFYLEQSGISSIEFSFKLSDKYDENKIGNFIKDEIYKSGMEFDKFYSNLYNGNIKYIKKNLKKFSNPLILIFALIDKKEGFKFLKENYKNDLLEVLGIEIFNTNYAIYGSLLDRMLKTEYGIKFFIEEINRTNGKFLEMFYNIQDILEKLSQVKKLDSLYDIPKLKCFFQSLFKKITLFFPDSYFKVQNEMLKFDEIILKIVRNNEIFIDYRYNEGDNLVSFLNRIKGDVLLNKKTIHLNDLSLKDNSYKNELRLKIRKSYIGTNYNFEDKNYDFIVINGAYSIVSELLNINGGFKFFIEEFKGKDGLEIIKYNPIIIKLLLEKGKGLQYLTDILNLETDNIKIQISDFIETSNSGSCLLSGYRGTGKTSLLSQVIKNIQDKNTHDKSSDEIIKVLINIPEQKKDEDGKTKSFSKNELLTKIIREIYHSLIDNGYSGKELENFENQYIRTFNTIDNIEKDEKSNELKLNFSIKDFLLFIITTVLIIFGWKVEMIKNNALLQLILVIIGFIGLKLSLGFVHKKSNSTIIKNLYTDEIAEYTLNQNIKYFNIGKTKKRKFVIIIDELDKLLDFEKNNGVNKLNMNDIFDVLGKLKTLFFDNEGAIFFVVTNKDAYNYYLENKHMEDDLISNIFNKVLYLPMTRKENFNINQTFEIDGIDEEDIDKKSGRKNDYFNNWIYYKSHGNWRKANFILNQKLNGKEIILDKNEIEYDNKFYKFMDILYDIFFDETKEKFKEYIKPGKELYNFIEKYILEGKFIDGIFENTSKYQSIINKIINRNSHTERKIKGLAKKYKNSVPFDTFAYIFSSVDKISGEPAYRDFIMNSILNILEIIKNDRTLILEDIFIRLKFTEIDFKYPVFEDLVLIWIPFFVYYFDNEKDNEK